SLAQDEVHHPASPNMFARRTAVDEHVGLMAPSFFEGIGQHRQALGGPVIVNALCQLDHRGIVPRCPLRSEGHKAEWKEAEDVLENLNQWPIVSRKVMPQVSSNVNPLRSYILRKRTFCQDTGQLIHMPVEESCFTQRRFLRPLLLLESAKFLHFCPGSGNLCGVRLTICQTLSDFNGPAALLIGELMPNMATAGTNEQPQL